MTTGKTIALTRRTFVGKVMSLLFNMLSRLVITFLPRNKRLLISWLQSPSAVILEPKKISVTFHCFPIYLPWSDGLNLDIAFTKKHLWQHLPLHSFLCSPGQPPTLQALHEYVLRKCLISKTHAGRVRVKNAPPMSFLYAPIPPRYCAFSINLFIFNWKTIALQYCVHFCHTSTWVSHRCMYVPSLSYLPPTSHPFTPT